MVYFLSRNLFGNANIGEYFRQFIGYGAIAFALIIHAWRNHRNAEKAREALRRQVNQAKQEERDE